MKFLFDFFPIIFFFVAYKFLGIFAATVTAMSVAAGQTAYVWFTKKKVEPQLWVSALIIIFLGGATLIFKNEMFIKWKPTAIYTFFGGAILFSQYFFKKNIVKTMLGVELVLPDEVWSRVNMSWAAFFLTLAFLNIYVAYNFSTDVWVNFKLFGALGATILFAIVQSFYLVRYL